MALLWTVLVLVLGSCSTAEVKNLSKPSTPDDVMIKVTDADQQILRRASEILSNETQWNRHDNRECPKNAVKFSLYCALFKASLDINGLFDHRLAALEEVRRSIEVESNGKAYEHRLMGYNNDATTQFKDIRRLLAATEMRLQKRLNSSE